MEELKKIPMLKTVGMGIFVSIYQRFGAMGRFRFENDTITR